MRPPVSFLLPERVYAPELGYTAFKFTLSGSGSDFAGISNWCAPPQYGSPAFMARYTMLSSRYSDGPVTLTLRDWSTDIREASASGGYASGSSLRNFSHFVGSRFADRLTGNSDTNYLHGYLGADIINGGGGGDYLVGGSGADTLDGGAGEDTAVYRMSKAGVTVNLSVKDAAGYSTGSRGEAAGDRLRNIENLTGSAHDDILTGDDGANVLIGLDGVDILKGGGGADTLDGGKGMDTVSYYRPIPFSEHHLTGVTVDLSDPDGDGYGTGSGGDAEGDRLRNIENVIGSDRSDILIGNDRDNVFDGLTGSDVIDGRGGRDTASWRYANWAVRIDLSDADGDGYVTAHGSGGAAADHRLKNIENLTGSIHDDTLTGDGNANVLDGGRGADTLNGGAGADRLNGGAGADRLTGGGGRDVFDVSETAAGLGRADVITDFARDDDRLVIGDHDTTQVWVARRYDNYGNTDTVIYADADMSRVYAVLEDYAGVLEAGHFLDHDGNALNMTVEFL